MSADLLAAFGDPSTPTQPSSDVNRGKGQDASHSKPIVDPYAILQSSYSPQPSTVNRGTASSSRQDTEVLFDASTEFTLVDDGDEEWGEFESAEQPSNHNDDILLIEDDETIVSPSKEAISGHVDAADDSRRRLKSPELPEIDLLSIGDEPKDTTSKARTAEQPVRSTGRRPPGLGNFVKSPQNRKEEVEEDEDEDWGDFIDGEKETSPKSTPRSDPSTRRTSVPPQQNLLGITPTQRTAHERKPEPKREERIVRPTNVPPPSILLPLFPPVLLESRRAASAYKSKDNPSGLSNEDIPSNILRNLKAMAHVLLGRQLRWKRDHILSQSTKIGPARSGKPGGMKLSSVNKTENVKEEQEAVEVVETWKKHSTILNSAISAAGYRPIPPVFPTMQVRTAKAEEGALKATHSCALCGLKRDERIPKVDEDANDSFGEWWIEHWGHSDCKFFWEANYNKLDQR